MGRCIERIRKVEARLNALEERLPSKSETFYALADAMVKAKGRNTSDILARLNALEFVLADTSKFPARFREEKVKERCPEWARKGKTVTPIVNPEEHGVVLDTRWRNREWEIQREGNETYGVEKWGWASIRSYRPYVAPKPTFAVGDWVRVSGLPGIVSLNTERWPKGAYRIEVEGGTTWCSESELIPYAPLPGEKICVEHKYPGVKWYGSYIGLTAALDAKGQVQIDGTHATYLIPRDEIKRIVPDIEEGK